MSLRVEFIGRELTLFAMKRWHYSGTLPAGRIVSLGAAECDRLVGAVVFGRGASSEIHSPFNLQQFEVCELCRVALGPHRAPTSKVVAVAIRLLRRQSPCLRLIVSYADPERGHHGGLYQAMNFLYLGTTNREGLIQIRGELRHPRSVTSLYGTRSIDWLRKHIDPEAAHVRTLPKHRYALPLDEEMRLQLVSRVKSHPKRQKEQDPAQSQQGWMARLQSCRSIANEVAHGQQHSAEPRV